MLSYTLPEFTFSTLMKRLPKNQLIPFISVLGTQLLSLTASDYGVCMATHGYGIILLLVYFWLYKNNMLSFFKKHFSILGSNGSH